MPRPCKKRRICGVPKIQTFAPSNTPSISIPNETITMTFDEYEVLRLIDLEGLTHEECAKQMNISRPSVSAICESAHRKVTDMIVHGKQLHIDGGHITICERSEHCCGTCGKGNCQTCEQTCKCSET